MKNSKYSRAFPRTKFITNELFEIKNLTLNKQDNTCDNKIK